MATLRDFISRVVPWPQAGEGVVNLHWTVPDRKGVRGRPYIDVDEFVSMVGWCNNHPKWVKDIYFCLSQQSDTGKVIHGNTTAKRLANNATALRSLWLDLDGNKEFPKGYPSKVAAATALTKFCQDSGYPSPSAIVDSGNGLHVYWISDKPLTPTEWLGYATGLWNEVQKQGLIADPVTLDAARVLRVPGTFNCKTQPAHEVKILALAATDYNFEATLKEKFYKTSVIKKNPADKEDLIGKPSAKFAGLQPETFSGLEDQDLVDWKTIYPECAFIRNAFETGGKDYTQPMWNLTTLAATFMEDGHALSHKFGNQHAGYTREGTEDLWNRKQAERANRGIGWPSCRAIHSAGCTACASCPHFGQIKSPLQLGTGGTRTRTDTKTDGNAPSSNLQPGPFTVAASPAPTKATNPYGLDLPDGYAIDPKTGFVCREETFETDKDSGIMDTVLRPLLLCKIVEQPWAERDPDTLHIKVTKSLGHEIEVAVPMADMANNVSTLAAFGKHGVKWEVENETKIRRFLMHYLKKLNDEKAARKAVPFGWNIEIQDGESKITGFAYASKLFGVDGSTLPCGTGDAETRAEYQPIGKIEPWFQALKLVTGQHRPELEVLTAVAFAAPLMTNTGLPNATLSAFGSPGGNKSTAIEVGLGVWGHPKRTKIKPDASKKGLLQKMGQLRNLPLYWDDIKKEDSEKVTSTINSLSQGGEGLTLTRNREQNHTGSWESLLVVAANHSLADEFVQRNKNDAATLYRTFEFPVEKPATLPPNRLPHYVALQIMRELETNFGRIGEKYAAILAADPEGIHTMVKKVTEQFDKAVGGLEEERFWVAVCAALIAGAMLANTIGCDFHLKELSDFLAQAYIGMRNKVKSSAVQSGTQDNTSDTLAAFLKECAGNTIRIRAIPNGGHRGKPGRVEFISGPRFDLGRTIHVQWALNDRLLRLSRSQFDKFLSERKVSSSNVMRGLKEFYKVSTTRGNLAAGVNYNGAAEQLLVIPVEEGTELWTAMVSFTPFEDQEINTTNEAPIKETGITRSGQ